MSLLNDIAQIETTLGDPGARPCRPLPDRKDTHRSTHTQMALFRELDRAKMGEVDLAERHRLSV